MGWFLYDKTASTWKSSVAVGKDLLLETNPFSLQFHIQLLHLFFQMRKQFKAQAPVFYVHTVSLIVEVWNEFRHYSFTNTQFFQQWNIFWVIFSLQK